MTVDLKLVLPCDSVSRGTCQEGHGYGNEREIVTCGATGLASWRNYGSERLKSDVPVGVSVAAVALLVGVAYAQLAGFTRVVGLYASILPPIAYALFRSSRQLIVGPDSAIRKLPLSPYSGGLSSRTTRLPKGG